MDWRWLEGRRRRLLKTARTRRGTDLDGSRDNYVTMSGIQQAMSLLIASFHKYSGKEGDKLTLSKVELKELLHAELGEMLGKASDKSAVDRIFKDLDSNKDNTVDFKEYVTLVSCLTVMCNDFFIKK
uniref:Protein S100 n=1 Tax=Hucho hucho TaxID=62062 RepID=A0A4W5RQL6_9TELE